MCAKLGEGICWRVAWGCGDDVNCWLRVDDVREGMLRMLRPLGERRAEGEGTAGGGAGVPAGESDGDSSELMSMTATAGLTEAAGPQWLRHRRHGTTRRTGQSSGHGSRNSSTAAVDAAVRHPAAQLDVGRCAKSAAPAKPADSADSAARPAATSEFPQRRRHPLPSPPPPAIAHHRPPPP